VEPTQPGTAIVHLAPLFGEDDYRVCKEQQIITESDMHSLELIDSSGNITNNHPFANTYDSKHLILDTETDIIKDLKNSKALVKIQQIRHEYPYCYRTDTPLIYRACESFYVDIQAIKQRMIELNRGIKWFPEHIGAQRFNNWLEGAKDWCISRSRFFGTPIPVWISEDGSDMQVISSIAQLESLTGVKLDDIHPEYVNHLEFTIGGKRYTRVLDIFDCWFESGAVPFAQYHYPFNSESRTLIDTYVHSERAMCDFIAEGLDQTRGWFYTLLVLSTALFDVAPAKNILTVGLVLDSQKRKISKKLGNYVDVEKLLETHGTDAIRLYILQSGITAAEPIAFREDDLQVISKTLYQFKNCWDFLAEHITHMHHLGHMFNSAAYLEHQESDILGAMDKWIICYMNNLSQELIIGMDADYNLSKAVRSLLDGVENITNWYLKFNRDRLKGKVGVNDWRVASSVLFQVIRKWCILIAPFAPFFSQWIYQQQCKYDNTITTTKTKWIHQQRIHNIIHLEGVNMKLSLETFNLLQRVARMVRAARMKTTNHTSSKTPIKRLEICMDNAEGLEKIAGCIDLIQSELNVIDIAYASLEGNISYRVIPNKALLGKKYKKQAGDIYKVIESISTVSKINDKVLEPILCSLANGQEVSINPDEYTLEPVFGDNDIYDTTTGGEWNILARIDFTYNKEIESLAAVRRFISHVQQSRKATNLHPWDAISIEISKDDFDIISSNREYIQQRLGCIVNPASLLPADKQFTLEDDPRVITYMILRLSLKKWQK
jgi:isoleucyl-tRNA synthetase